MCIVLYLGTDVPVPTSQWSDADPRFRVMDLLEAEEPVREHFSRRYVYYLASHEKCGCGFDWDAERDEKEIAEYADEWKNLPEGTKKELNWTPAQDRAAYEARRQNADSLVVVLRSVLEESEEAEIYAMTDGDESGPPTSRKTTTPDDIIGKRFGLFPDEFEGNGERILHRIVKSKPV